MPSPIDFPNSPSNGDFYTADGKTWQFNGVSWNLLVGTANIGDGTVTADKIGSGAVTEGKIGSGAVTEAKIGSSAVTAGKIANGAVNQDKLGTSLSAVTVCTSSTRPNAPFTGQLVFETDTKKVRVWDGSSWLGITLAPPDAPTSLSAVPSTTSVAISFTPGSDNGSAITNYEYAVSTDGGSSYGAWTAFSPEETTSPVTVSGLTKSTAYHVKLRGVNNIGSGTESSAVSFTTLVPSITVDYLVVAGGGGGGVATIINSGGGGGGGYKTSVSGATNGGGLALGSQIVLQGTYAVTVGGGGSVQANGTASTISTVTSDGGGRGGSYQGGAGSNGGCGGGGAGAQGGSNSAGGTGSAGYNGGSGFVNFNYPGSGGGGGAGGGGGNGAFNVNGGGGAGLANSITGSSVTRAAGGAGSGGGSAGGTNTGNGGAGGAAGGSGVVIVRYLTADAVDASITGGTITTSGSYTIHTFNTSGSLAIS